MKTLASNLFSDMHAVCVHSWMNTAASACMSLWVSVAIFQLVPIFLSVVAGMRLIKRKDYRIARLAFSEEVSHQSHEMLVSRTVLGPTSFVCTALRVCPWFPRTWKYMDLGGAPVKLRGLELFQGVRRAAGLGAGASDSGSC